MIRTASVAAAIIAVVIEAFAVAISPVGAARWNEVAVGCAIVAYASIGVLILWHRPRHLIGMVAAAIAPVWAAGQLLVAWSANALTVDAGNQAAALASVIGGTLRGLPWLVVVLWLPIRFPDGAPAHTRLRRFAERFAIATIALSSLAQLLSPELPDLRFGDIRNPIGMPSAWTDAWNLVTFVPLLMSVAGIVLAVVCLIQEYRGGNALGRQQTAVFGIAFLAPICAFAVTTFGVAPPWVFGLTSVVLPVAIGVAVLQRRLYDIPLVVDRSLTYGALSLAIAAIYALVVGGVGVMLRQPGAAWLAWLGAAVVAVTFAPLRDAVQGGANRLVYGQWSRPAEVVARTSGRLRDASDIPGLLQSLVDELGSGLALDHVAVSDTAGAVLAQHGSPGADTDELPVVAYGTQVGTLTWTRRRLRESDRALLGELATQLGTVVHATTLLDTVRASQERLVLAGEEERRRLRRDLHDGLGPTLAALTLQVDTLRNGLRGSESRASIGADGLDAALLELRGGIQTTVADVRRIVEGLRPPALDELGLADAIEELGERLAAGSGLAVEINAGRLTPMSAAAEVAAYRIVQEALTNAVRHARATRVTVTIETIGAELVISVADDGIGAVAPRANGVGLLSMRERATALGGDLGIDALPGRGTTITARLPIPVGIAGVAVAG